MLGTLKVDTVKIQTQEAVMIELVKWTLGFVTLMMAYILMVIATANAAEATYAGIIEQLVM